MSLARYTKALVPAVGSIMAVLYGWANTGHWDVPTLRLAVVGLVYAVVVYLLPNVPMPTPPAPAEPTTRYATGGLVAAAVAESPWMQANLPEVPVETGPASVPG